MIDRTLDVAPKHIGILTSGGDCPGLNAVIYAVVKYACATKHWRVYGIPNGTDGFVDIAEGICRKEDFELYEHSFDIPGQKGINVLLFLSGSVLGCRGKKTPRSGESAKILQSYRQMGLDALIAVGGDGSPLATVIAQIKAVKQARQTTHQTPCAAPVDPEGFMLHTARSLGIYVGY